MELTWIKWTFFFVLGVAAQPEEVLETKPEVVGMMGGLISVDCGYQNNENWYVIQWQRLVNGSEPLTIVTLPNSFSVSGMKPGAKWNEDLDPSFRKRLRAFVSYDKSGVKFNLEIYNFQCNDTGVYACVLTGNQRMTSQSTLKIQAKPSPPAIHNDLFLVEQENNSVTLECEGSVGLPPAKLVWYQQFPNRKEFLIVSSQSEEQETELRSECNPHAIRRLDVIVTRPISGSVFRCVAESPLLDQNDNLFDEVIVKIQDPEPTPLYKIACEGGGCPTTQSLVNSPNHAAVSLSSTLVSMIMVCAVLFFTSCNR